MLTYLKRSEIPSAPDDQCSICPNTFRRPVKTDCGHIFCLKCIKKWFARSETCPLCRDFIFATYPDDVFLDAARYDIVITPSMENTVMNSGILQLVRAVMRASKYYPLLRTAVPLEDVVARSEPVQDAARNCIRVMIRATWRLDKLLARQNFDRTARALQEEVWRQLEVYFNAGVTNARGVTVLKIDDTGES